MALPWTTLASVPTKDGVLELRRRGEKDFLITIAGRVLMTSSAHRSEDALAKLACTPLQTKKAARVLVSGLGMGFTLRAALDELAEDAKVVVAELNPVVVDWCTTHLAPLIGDAVRDKRVKVEVIDVAKYLANAAAESSRPFDAIVLDMYEGPQAQVNPQDPLYSVTAMRRTHACLKVGGTLAVWCEGRSLGFEGSLRGGGFDFRMERHGRGARIHHVYVARALARTPSPPTPQPAAPAARRPPRTKPTRPR